MKDWNLDVLWNLLLSPSNVLGTILISSLVSAVVVSLLKRMENRDAAEVEYKYGQKKRHLELIGLYHGRLLDAANTMSYRFRNLYENHSKGWLNVEGKFNNRDNYYFQSSVYRFLNVCAVVRQVESEAILLDKRIAEKKDFTFLNYVAVLHWVMTDVSLVKGLTYDSTHEVDHFFSDRFRRYCDVCLVENSFLSMAEFSDMLEKDDPEVLPVLHFFDGLSPDEDRLRWDRLVAFHLILMAFINSFGYGRQQSSQRSFELVAKQIKNKCVLRNLVTWLEKHDLGDDKEALKIKKAVTKVVDEK